MEDIRKFYPFFCNLLSSQRDCLFTFLSIQVLLRVCSPDLLMSELDSIRAASLHTVPPHHDQRRVGVRRLVLVQCFYCVAGRPRPLSGSRSQCGPKLSQLHQSEFGDFDLYNYRQSHAQNPTDRKTYQ